MFLKVVLVLVSVVVCFATDLPPFIRKCQFGDVECIAKTATETLKNYRTELSQMGFGQFEPFRVDKVTIDESLEMPVDLKLILTNCSLGGLSTITFARAVGWTKDAAKSKFESYGNIPTLNFTGNYDAEGHIMLLPIRGNGQYNITLADVSFEFKFKPSVEIRDGKQYLKIKKIKIRIDPAKFNIKLTNLFGGNKELGNYMNEVLNENWRDAWNELSPALYDINEIIALDTMQGFFDKFAYDDIFLPDK